MSFIASVKGGIGNIRQKYKEYLDKAYERREKEIERLRKLKEIETQKTEIRKLNEEVSDLRARHRPKPTQEAGFLGGIGGSNKEFDIGLGGKNKDETSFKIF